MLDVSRKSANAVDANLSGSPFQCLGDIHQVGSCKPLCNAIDGSHHDPALHDRDAEQ